MKTFFPIDNGKPDAMNLDPLNLTGFPSIRKDKIFDSANIWPLMSTVPVSIMEKAGGRIDSSVGKR